MTPTLSSSVMAHPDREQYIPYLKKRLGNVPVAFDNGNGIWDTCRRSWLLYNPESTHHVVIQDDAIICDDFYRRAINIISRHPVDTAHIFYLGERAEKHAIYHKGTDGFFTQKIYNEVAICLPTKHILPMLKWCDSMKVDNDQLIGKYCRRHSVRIYNPIPSLVDHRSDTSIYRTMYNKPEPDAIRHAIWFIDNPQPPCLQEQS